MKHLIHRVGASTAVLYCMMACASAAATDFSPVGGNVLVNVSTTGAQMSPAIGHSPCGEFVVAWENITANPQQGIYARRYDASGSPLGSEFVVDAQVNGVIGGVSAAMDPAGNFVIAWHSGQDLGGTDAPGTGLSFGIFAKRFDASGGELPPAPGTQGQGVGNEFQVNTTIIGPQQSPDVAMDANGNFIVVWVDRAANDGDGEGIFGKRYNAAGEELPPAPGTQGSGSGNEFQVNGFTTGNQRLPWLSMDAAGNFLVAWTSAGQDGDAESIIAKRYHANGQERTPPLGVVGVGVGNEFQVNTFTAGTQFGSPAALHPTNGTAVISWSSFPQGIDSFAKRYDAVGNETTPLGFVTGVGAGNEFRVNTFQTGGQFAQSIAINRGGTSIISWVSNNQDVGLSEGVYAKVYGSLGAEIFPTFDQGQGVGSEFQVGELDGGRQGRPEIGVSTGGFVIVFEESDGRDGDGAGIYLQRYVLNSTPQPVPTVSEWGLIVMALLGLAAGVRVFARRPALAGVAADSSAPPVFSWSAYAKILMLTLACVAAGFSVAILLVGTVDAVDVWGTLISAVIVAYIVQGCLAVRDS